MKLSTMLVDAMVTFVVPPVLLLGTGMSWLAAVTLWEDGARFSGGAVALLAAMATVLTATYFLMLLGL